MLCFWISVCRTQLCIFTVVDVELSRGYVSVRIYVHWYHIYLSTPHSVVWLFIWHYYYTLNNIKIFEMVTWKEWALQKCLKQKVCVVLHYAVFMEIWLSSSNPLYFVCLHWRVTIDLEGQEEARIRGPFPPNIQWHLRQDSNSQNDNQRLQWAVDYGPVLTVIFNLLYQDDIIVERHLRPASFINMSFILLFLT